MAIDAVIRDVVPENGTLRLDLEPRRYGLGEVTNSGHFSLPGQRTMRIEPPITWLPRPGMAIWGDAGRCEITGDGESRWYYRVGYTSLHERREGGA